MTNLFFIIVKNKVIQDEFVTWYFSYFICSSRASSELSINKGYMLRKPSLKFRCGQNITMLQKAA